MPSRQLLTDARQSRLLHRLATQFAAAVAEGSEVHETPGYRIHVWPTADPFYRNVAIPIDAAASTQSAVAAMLRVFAANGRRARLEFFEELWPDLSDVLEQAGLFLERRGEVMVHSVGVPCPAMSVPRVQALDAATPRGLLDRFLDGAAAAFGEPAAMLATGEVDRLALGLRTGTVVAAAAMAGKTPVAGASVIRAGAVGELVGVWCLQAWRRRGLARSSCRLVIERFFRAGGEVVWLSAGDAASTNLYRGLGFVACGTQLNFAEPAVA
jgi:ribosomal protein S18 acetylase RimI-like enzyme